ncbi:hypothetical protein D3C81_1235550 [compost metagenome]
MHLAFLAISRCRQRHHAKDTRTDALGQRLDRAALAGAIAPFKNDADLDALGDHPFLQLDQFDVQFAQLVEVILVFQLQTFRRCGGLLFAFCHDLGPLQ